MHWLRYLEKSATFSYKKEATSLNNFEKKEYIS